MTRAVLIHDAAIDEYIAFLLLAAMPEVELLGTVIVNADCIGGPAMQTQWQLQTLIGRPELPLTLSGVRGMNPFPWEYRSDCVRLGRVPALQQLPRNPAWPAYPDGDAWLAELFRSLDEPIVVVCLCPLTPLQVLFDAVPGAAVKIERLIWMAGAVDVAGNLDPRRCRRGSPTPTPSGTSSGIRKALRMC